MKKIIFSLLALFCFVNTNAQEVVIWDGTPANYYDQRWSADKYQALNLQVGDVIRVFLCDITEEQKVYLKIEGGSVNSPDVMAVGTTYFDHTLTQDNIDKMVNKDGLYTTYKGGLYVKIQDGKTGKVYRVTLRRKGTPKNQFAICLGNTTAATLSMTSDNKLRLVQTADIAQNDTVVVKYSISDYNSATTYKIWTKNSSRGGSDGLPDVLSPNADGVGEMRIALPQDKAEGLHNGMILQTSTTTITIKDVLICKYVKPSNEVLPPSTEIVLWSGNVTTGSVDLRYGTVREAVRNANISAKDTIKIYMMGVDDGDKVILKEAKTWDGREETLTVGQNVIEYPIWALYAEKINYYDPAKLDEGSFIVQRGTDNDYAVRNITVAKFVPKPVPAVEVLAEGDTYIQWDGSVCVIPKSQLSNLTVGDKLHVYINHWYTSASTKDNKIEDPNKTNARLAIHRMPGTKGHDYITANSVYMINSLPNNEFVLEFTQEVYNKMFKDNGDMWDLAVSGYWYSFSKVTLEHPNVTVTEIVENRATPANSYGTICLPYDATAEGAAIFKLAGKNAEATGLVFEYATGNSDEESTTLEAGVPYLYRATADAQTFTCDMNSTTTEAKTINGFMGTYSKIERISGYFLNTADDMFHPAADYVNVGAYKCYIPSLDAVEVYTPSAARQAVVFGIFGSEATGVTSLNTSNVSSSSKYIQNGQIVVVKNGQKYNTAGQLLK